MWCIAQEGGGADGFQMEGVAVVWATRIQVALGEQGCVESDAALGSQA